MRFWDSSALVALVVEEPASERCRGLLTEDSAVAVWALTRIEMLSAIHRKIRAGELDRQAKEQALERVGLMRSSWSEVSALDEVCDRAARLLALHHLRAADALQLAAALILCEERPQGWSFVTTDPRLVAAASAEGFLVLEP